MLKKIMLLCLVIVFSCGLVGCESEAEKQAALELKKQEEMKAMTDKMIGDDLAKTKGHKGW